MFTRVLILTDEMRLTFVLVCPFLARHCRKYRNKRKGNLKGEGRTPHAKRNLIPHSTPSIDM
jgi:hypothetical protein